MFVGTFCIGFVCIFGFCLLYIWFLFVVYLFLFVRYLISVCYIFDFCLLCIWFLFVIYLIFVCYIFDFCLHIWFFSGRVPDLVSVLLAGTQRHSLMLLDSGVCTSSTSSSSKPPPSSSSITTPSLPSSWLVSYYHFSLSFHPLSFHPASSSTAQDSAPTKPQNMFPFQISKFYSCCRACKRRSSPLSWTKKDTSPKSRRRSRKGWFFRQRGKTAIFVLEKGWGQNTFLICGSGLKEKTRSWKLSSWRFSICH